MMKGSPTVNENSEALELVKTGGYAFMTDSTQLEYLTLSDCGTFELAGEFFNAAGLGYVLPENAPFLEAFNHQ